jgi:cysteine-rich repeat protein
MESENTLKHAVLELSMRCDLQITRCGDGIVDREQGEQCDDGNDDYHDSCIGKTKIKDSFKFY